MTLALRGRVPDGLVRADVLRSLRTSAEVWTAQPCTSMKIRIVDGGLASASSHDRISTVAFLDHLWCRSGVDRPGHCYNDQTAAMTTLRLGKGGPNWADVPITEADVELNAVTFAWSVARTPSSGVLDLGEVLVHEIGHVLGFAHTCRYAGARGRDARRLPVCEPPGESRRGSVMRPGADVPIEGLIAQTTLLSDGDRRGVCEVYPARQRRQN